MAGEVLEEAKLKVGGRLNEVRSERAELVVGDVLQRD